MTINFGYSVVTLITVASVTGFTRALPYILFGRKKELPELINYLGTALPASIMIILWFTV